MSTGNGHAERIGRVEADHRDLRQLVLDALKSLTEMRQELEHVAQQTKYNGAALDDVLRLLKLIEVHEDASG